MAGRHIGSNPTENRAIGRADSDYAGEELRRRQELREQADAARNARLRRLRENQDALANLEQLRARLVNEGPSDD